MWIVFVLWILIGFFVRYEVILSIMLMWWLLWFDIFVLLVSVFLLCIFMLFLVVLMFVLIFWSFDMMVLI